MQHDRSTGKLVRDRIPELISADGGQPDVRRLSESQLEEALLAKLVEEVTELLEARHDGRLEESADVVEVLLALLGLQGLGLDDLLQEVVEKREAKGAFRERFWLG